MGGLATDRPHAATDGKGVHESKNNRGTGA
jgi:hypothetical protein